MLIAPHGGVLINRQLEPEEARRALAEADGLPELRLTSSQLRDVENLALGLLSPIDGFQGPLAIDHILTKMRLPSGLPWTIPIVLDVAPALADPLVPGTVVVLADEAGQGVGRLFLEEVFEYDREVLAQGIFGTVDPAHPGVAVTLGRHPAFASGKVELIRRLPDPYARYNLTPAETRVLFKERGFKTIVAFQTRNPVHRAHEYIQKCALEIVDGLLVHPLVGETDLGDVPAEVRLECYEVLLAKYFPKGRTFLSVFPVNMRYAGPREAIFHALIRKNYGCTHFIVGRDHAGVGTFYDPKAAWEIFDAFEPSELGITPLFFEHTFYCRGCQVMASEKTCPHGPDDRVVLSGTLVRKMLTAGKSLPPEFTRPEFAAILERYYQQTT
ncbi:MAG: sulfate adenylyltransferase [Candidatus Tectimicrobiota bacterium]